MNLSLPRCNPHRLPSAAGLCKAGKSRYVSYLCLPSLCVTLTLLARRGRKLYAMEGRTKSSLAAGVDCSTLNAHSIKCSQIFVLFLTKNAAFFIFIFFKETLLLKLSVIIYNFDVRVCNLDRSRKSLSNDTHAHVTRYNK